MNKILVILGPTSTGKTDLALTLAKKFHGEIVSADSRQVYVGLDIGTGKMPGINLKVKLPFGGPKSKVRKGKGFWEIDGVKIWMYDIANPKRQYNTARFVKDATKIIRDIQNRGKLPILVGGTGLYIKAITEGLSNLTIPVDRTLRKNLEKLSLDKLQKKLQEASSLKWEKMNNSDKKNPRRLIRAIELSIMSLREAKPRFMKLNNNILKIGLTAPREILYQRIDERVASRLNQGMIEEAVRLHKTGLSLRRMRQLGLEYGVLADFLSGKIKKENLSIVLQGKIHGYARRQLTWFKKEREVNWFDITTSDYLQRIENSLLAWYNEYLVLGKFI
ncbi:hypothetical protein A3C26_01050 [Candidatus Daviesbacteria bacterium RIFCSPHIGHO2_02_FULL_39_12]|uniref:tRNA dimethylallyltransferase n=2 Tax=Candidatus Daviesiibacteriota TaxID=1752718 RepID=A0A1F5JDH4_9BACT|nr:MAG: hypothetical protein A3C26_01050 [Candidatus Daviesbacteria bacterium RIFCSPHIGHO2_02_FULL_39_12]OGE72639.1 MAG: hypothetical protein A3H40_01120 [Candidatus Daviesbacteria bacterium RIFCSPLOWO2_02_FULL_38_15]